MALWPKNRCDLRKCKNTTFSDRAVNKRGLQRRLHARWSRIKYSAGDYFAVVKSNRSVINVETIREREARHVLANKRFTAVEAACHYFISDSPRRENFIPVSPCSVEFSLSRATRERQIKLYRRGSSLGRNGIYICIDMLYIERSASLCNYYNAMHFNVNYIIAINCN